MQMHKDFADWYRAVELEPQAVALEKRWATVDRLTEVVDSGRGLDLVRFFVGLKPRAEDFSAWFPEEFKTEDPAFQMKNNAAELQVLAGALCIAGLHSDAQDGDLSDAIALALVASTPKAKREKFELCDIISAGQDFLLNRSKTIRAAAMVASSEELRAASTALKKVCTGNNTVGHMEKPFAVYIDKVEDKLQALSRQHNVLTEETNILWWLMGGFSEDLDRPFTEVDAGCMAMVAPKELSDRVVLLPGPISARAFLSAAIRQSSDCKEVSLAEAIEKTPKIWRQARFTNGQDAVLDLCPALLCLKKSLEGSKSQWQSQATRGSRFPLKEKFAPVEIAHQVYTEYLLLRAVQCLNG